MRPLHARLAAGLFALLVLSAGCLGGGGTATEESASPSATGGISQDILPTATRATFSNETGGVEGTVYNDVGARLKEAHVVLIGTPHSSFADARGEFSMSDVDPGEYLMRVDVEEYRALEQSVQVAANSVTRVNITMVPTVDSGAGYREHLHDLWGGATEETIFEDTVQLRYSTVCTRIQGVITVNGDCYMIPLPTDNHVKPGTQRLEVTVKWSSQYVPTVRFDYQPANFSQFIAGPILKPGETAKVSVTPPMHDGGHARYTMWSLRIRAAPAVVTDMFWLNQNDFNDRFVGPFQVKVVAFKGEVAGEPPHERFWANGTRVKLLDGVTNTINSFPRTRSPTETTCSATAVCWVIPKGLVPPGATRLEVNLTYAPDDPYKTAWEPIAKRKSLVFRTSRVDPQQATWDSLRYDKAVSNERGKVMYDLKLEAVDLDAFYQQRSNWLFILGNEGDERNANYVDDCPGYVGGCPGVRYRLYVTAINDDWTPELAG